MKNSFYISDINVSDAVSNQNTGGFKDGNTNPALDDYEYDENGNMVKDRNKGITSISYNYLNLPELIIFENSNSIEYVYNAAGVKLKKTVIEETATPEVRKEVDYLDGFQYAGEVLNFFPTAEGYVRATPTGSLTPGSPPTGYAYSYVYNYTDHLGNVRLSYSMDHLTGKLKILEESHYYPFGLRHGVYDTGGKKDFSRNPGDGIEPEPGLPPVLDYVTRMEYQYKYNGKEWQDELGLNIYDFEARNYMPDIGRTTTQDPLTENFVNQSSYSFFNNNPIRFADPTGMAGEDFIDVDKYTGKGTVTEAPGDDKMRLIGEGGKVEKIETYGENGSFNRDNNITTNDIFDSNGDYLRTEQIIESKNPDKLFNLFEFAASDGNTVEYGFLRTQDGWKSNGYLYTSGLAGSLGDQFQNFFDNLMNSSLFLNVTELWHNHNSSSFRPSGFEEDGSISEWYNGDRGFLEMIKNKYINRVPQSANILLPNTNLMIQHDEKSFKLNYR